MDYVTSSCKFYEMGGRLEQYSKLGYTLHSFCVVNQGFNECVYMVLQK